MRMRKKKHTAERILACGELNVTAPEENKGKWRKIAEKKILCLEIGCGKGSFVVGMAKKHPDKFFVAMEKVPDVIMLAMEKVKEASLSNVLFICGDAEDLPKIFEKGEVDEIYLNFSDPWPKGKHAKRRLTYRKFLLMYKELFKVGEGVIYFKTDNRPFFDFSLEEFPAAGYKMSDITFDLHNSEYNGDNVVTEYEATFSAKGFRINRLVARPEK